MAPAGSTVPDTTTASAFLNGKLHHVDIDAIEKELYRLWAEADQEDGHVTRACSLSFIILSGEGNDPALAEEILTEITIKHPCRAILAIAEPAETESLEAYVTARCHMIPGDSGKQICCEQITVHWKGEGTRQLVSVVAPLTIPDLPTSIWWQEERLVIDKVKPFLPHIDRFIVDTLKMERPYSGLVGLESMLNTLTGGAAIYDLNWLRLLPFRQAIAYAFEERRGILGVEDLDLISEVEILVTADEGQAPDSQPISQPLSQPLLLIGWLASRLSWLLVSARKSDGGFDAVYRLSRTRIDTRVKLVKDESVTPGQVKDIRIGLRDRPDKVLRIWHKPGSPGLSTQLVPRDKVEDSRCCCKEKSQTELIDGLLDNPTRDPVLERAVFAACDMIRSFR